MDALEITKHLLSKVNIERYEDIGDGISNLKIQKLLFYIQKTSYSVYEKPFFTDKMEAWQYGPVIPTIYHEFKKYRSNNIDVIETQDFINSKLALDKEQLLIIDFVWDSYNKYSAGGLVDLTHNDIAWKKNFIPNLNHSIDLNDLKDKAHKNDFLAYQQELENISNLKLEL